MAVNTQKLLPASKSGGLALRTSRITVTPKEKERGGALVKSEGGGLSKEIFQMKTKVLKLQGAVNKNNKENQKEQDDKRKISEKEERAKREKKFETRGVKGIGLPNIVSRLPGGNIVDMIKRYLGFTFLGWLVGRYDELMPKLEKFMSIVKPVFEGLVFVTTSITKGVYAFVESGYKAYDKVSGLLKENFGANAEKTFNDFSGHLNKLLSGAIIAAMLVASTAPKGPKGLPGRTTPKGLTPSKPTGSKPSMGGYRSPGQARAGGFALEQARKKATQTSLTQSAKPVASKAGRFAKFGGGRIPIIGPLLTFGIRTMIYGERPEKAAAAAVGMGIGQAIGTFIGGLGAGALGLGTFGMGAVLAPLIIGAGSIIGGLVGEWIGAALYDFVAGSGGKNKKGSKKASGGTVGSKSTVVKKIKTTPTRKKVTPQQTSPGKDIGGKYKIEEFYGTERFKPDDPTNTQTRGEEIVKRLEKSSQSVKKLPVDWVASIGGAFIDLTLGQKPDRKLASDIAASFGSFVDAAINDQVSATTGQITKALFGMANGGSLPANNNKEIAKRIEKNIEQRLQTIFDQASNETLKNIKPESMMKTAEELREMQDRSRGRQGGGGGTGGGGGGEFSPLDYENLESGNISSMAGKAQVLYDEFRNIGYTDEAAKRLIAEIGREGGFSNKNLFGTHTDPAAGITNQGMISWNQTRRDALLKAAKSAGVLDSNGNLKQTAEALRFQARFLANEVPLYSKELNRLMRDDAATGSKISQLLKDKYIRYRTDQGYSGGPDPDFGSAKTKEWYNRMTPGLKLSSRRFLPMTGQSGSVSYSGQKNYPLATSYSPFTTRIGDPTIISGKGFRESTGTVHAGIDISARSGTPLFAYTSGTVVRSGDFGDGYGYVVEYRDSKGNLHFYAHMKNDPNLRPGTKIKEGQKIGEVGSTGRSQGPHLHWEIRNKNGVLVDPTKFTTENPLSSLTENAKPKGQQRKFDILIPLDHVPPHLRGKFPDKNDGKTFEGSKQLGADGRERQYQDLIAGYMAGEFKRLGRTVRVVKPEDFRSYEEYDNFITNQSKTGSTILPLHLDAPRSAGGKGFLTRIQKNDALDRKIADTVNPVLQKWSQIFKLQSGFAGTDTDENKTIRLAGDAPASLVELGSLVELEKRFGKNFPSHPQYRKFLQELASGVSSTIVKPQSQPPRENRPISTQEAFRRAMPAAKSYNVESIRRAQSAITSKKPKRSWYDPRGWFGLEGGGAAMSSNQPKSTYSTLNRTGTLKHDTSDGHVIVLYQPIYT